MFSKLIRNVLLCNSVPFLSVKNVGCKCWKLASEVTQPGGADNMMTLWERDPRWCDMWCGPHIPLSPACSLLLPRVVIHQLIWRKRWPGSPVMWFAIACFLLFTKVLWIEAFSVHKCSVLSYLWHENNKIILFSSRYCVSAVIKFHAVLKNNITCESSNWKMKRYYTSKRY